MLTSVDNKVFLVALTSKDESILVFSDWAELYSVDLNSQNIKLIGSRHMYNTGGLTGKAGIHFRYGASLQIRSQDEIWFYCSARNFVIGIGVNMYRGPISSELD